jgi:hypothetical protein
VEIETMKKVGLMSGIDQYAALLQPNTVLDTRYAN